ncbi:MAG: carbon storage regulator [Acidimicrobiales bacterium]
MLSRAAGQAIMVGPDIRVTILEIHGDMVRIGVDAPLSVDVHRDEIFLEVQRANVEAVVAPDEGG